jgi:hypothetical protein
MLELGVSEVEMSEVKMAELRSRDARVRDTLLRVRIETLQHEWYHQHPWYQRPPVHALVGDETHRSAGEDGSQSQTWPMMMMREGFCLRGCFDWDVI